MNLSRCSHGILGVAAGAVVAGGLGFNGAAAEEIEGACARPATEIFADAADQVVEVVGIGIDPFRLANRVGVGVGTGFVIEGGLVATNYHVIAGANSVGIIHGDITDDAYVVGIDPSLDLAVIAPHFLPLPEPVAFADGPPPRVGAPVYALGYPLGVGKSMTSGIVSGHSRVLARTTTSWLSPYLQTDAAVSPGNSGGPLLDACGRVVGMITLAGGTPEAENLGFAIPNDVLVPALAALAQDGRISRPWHGLFGQMVSFPILAMLGLPFDAWDEASGFLVETVEPGSAADIAQLRGGTWPVHWGGQEIILGGDIITEVDGTRIRTLDDALAAVGAIEIGETVHIRYLRDGVPNEVEVDIEERPLLEAEMQLYQPNGLARRP